MAACERFIAGHAWARGQNVGGLLDQLDAAGVEVNAFVGASGAGEQRERKRHRRWRCARAVAAGLHLTIFRHDLRGLRQCLLRRLRLSRPLPAVLPSSPLGRAEGIVHLALAEHSIRIELISQLDVRYEQQHDEAHEEASGDQQRPLLLAVADEVAADGGLGRHVQVVHNVKAHQLQKVHHSVIQFLQRTDGFVNQHRLEGLLKDNVGVCHLNL
mmetsp:Transcript_34676/g.98251  ORF Transcript_34676/g.98251 Transcript_34676/m.98251 type:complete len:214 (-) Transcript_34676:1184-1825(-)